MYRDTRSFTPNGPPTHAYEVGDNKNKFPLGGHFAAVVPTSPIVGIPLAGRENGIPNPFGGFKFQPLEMCPKNFIIFDQTNHSSRVMFNPALVHDLRSHDRENFDALAEEAHKSVRRGNENEGQHEASRQEDTEDIDALLGSEAEQEKEDDNASEVVSTGRTPGNNLRISSTDSYCTTKIMKFRRANISSHKSISRNSGSTKRNEDRMSALVQALRNIIPGSDDLDASAFLDEAVKYLKSLKLEVEELGVHNFDDY